MTTFTPTSATEVLDTVAWAVSEEAPLEILGHGSKRGIGRPAQTEHVIDLSQLTGITLYEPEELVLSARAGTPLAEIEALLSDNRQELAFEPMDYGPLLGGEAGRGTIGGALMSNLSGPRRIKTGAARDHVLGIHAVSGRGEAFKSGGRVVKNVTGYDLSKGLAGSWGTLAVATDVTFKVLPAAETETSVAVRGLTDEQAAFAMAAAMGSSAEVSGAAHLPETVTGKVIDGALKGMASTLFRIEGFGPSVDYRVDSLKHLLASQGEIDTLPPETSRLLWREIRDCRPFSTAHGKPLWRVSMTPSQGHAMVMALRMRTAADVFYDWQGGLIWIQMDVEPGAELLRGLVAANGGGHATLVRAAPSVRAAVPVFQPQPPALAALSARLKEQFDPKGVLNPGRMQG
ncbi:FAD-binding protein [Chelativorans sp. ZYF759]|uniref:FAD-binding protein n=1 Tax=Chelativorans sp. ZYF759 TaxID=2692213 RepID=UPI00145D3215|nr:FAD-binding protein [Chelativorans sp. ZYF759]NMG40749.1 FAD-binding protein [Chelativorans sp. ZYF759]